MAGKFVLTEQLPKKQKTVLQCIAVARGNGTTLFQNSRYGMWNPMLFKVEEISGCGVTIAKCSSGCIVHVFKALQCACCLWAWL